MRGQLWRYYPQFEEAADDVFHPWFLELRQHVPIPVAARCAKVILQVLRSKEMNVSQAILQGRIMRITSVVERMKVKKQKGRLSAASVRLAKKIVGKGRQNRAMLKS